MNKKLVIGFTAATLLALPLISLAVPFGAQPNSIVFSVPNLLNLILTVVWWIFIAIVVILFILAGISFLTAQGDPSKLEESRRFVIWGTVGIFVGILAFSIISVVGNIFGTNN